MAHDKHTLGGLLLVQYQLNSGLEGLKGLLEDLEALLEACQVKWKRMNGMNGV